jgi:hypothetical protein
MVGPNFFILGAPKCGTTALAGWLAEHPQVFMAPIKEPHFYSTDLGNRRVRTRDAYRRLFRGAGRNHRAVGEASVWYLFSDSAVPNLLADHPDARCIVCLRNPVTMAPSLHNQHVRAGNENQPDFARAWALQEARGRGEDVPRLCPDSQLLQYGPACSLGSQLARLYARIPRERVLPLVLDDLLADPAAEYRRTLAFLGLADDGRRAFPVVNAAGTRRSATLQRTLRALGRLRIALRLPRLGTGLTTSLARYNQRPSPVPAPDAATQAELARYFAPEIERLETLLERDLGAWKGSGPAPGEPAREEAP